MTKMIQLTLNDVDFQRMTAARKGLENTVAEVGQTAFISAAIQHYADHLADQINGGRDWLTDDQYRDVTSLRGPGRGRRPVYVPTVEWARVASKRGPDKIELMRQLNGARMLVAEIYADETPGKRKGYAAMLKAAGYEVDPERDETDDKDGNVLIPIRQRRN